METQSPFLMYVMTAFVVIAGISLLMQLGLIFGMYKVAKTLEEKVTTMLPKVEALIPKVQALVPKAESLLDSSQKIVEQGQVHVQDIGAKTSELLDSAKRQMATVEALVTDVSGRAKVQVDHAEMVVDDTMTRAHETVAMVHNGITRPLRQIHGIASGVRTALAQLAAGGRPSPAHATHDEEMFI